MGRDQCGNNDYSLDLYIVREVRTQYELEQRAGAPPRGGLHWTQVATSLRHCNHPLVVCKASVLNLFLESIPRDENAEQVFFFLENACPKHAGIADHRAWEFPFKA